MFNYNLFGGPLFEEFGWRGFLQVRLQEVLPPWIAAICVGLMWAAWHLPLFLIPRWSSALPPVFFLLLIGLSMTMAFGFNASGESVAVAILMHSAFNSSPRFFTAYLNRAPTPEYPSAELILGISFLLVGAALAVLTLGCLAADSS
jgi:membrane protease YdiL (CAAX protease family)